MGKAARIKREAKRAKLQSRCGHGSRYRTLAGCAKCRRQKGFIPRAEGYDR